EEKRVELVKSKTLGPEFNKKHLKAIYTSRSLNSLIFWSRSLMSPLNFVQ
ncbi:7225_t:CDS:1, partial [Funneliformis geosporum]